MNIWNAQEKILHKFFGVFVKIILVVLCAALLISIFFLTLSVLLLISQECASQFGYSFIVSDDLAKSVITVGGAVAVGAIALFGVHRQNLSAERRHRVDSSLALRKEILLDAAEAASVQYQILLSFSKPEITEADRAVLHEKIGAAYFRVQVVASQKTIATMLDSNEAWTRALLRISLLPPADASYEARMNRLIEIQKLSTPFMQKLWRFNLTARKEIECDFTDDDAYLLTMDEKFSRIELLFKEIKENPGGL